MKKTITLEASFSVPVGMDINVYLRLPPDLLSFRPEAFSFADAEDWWIKEFRIGLRSQLRGWITADQFRRALISPCDTVQTAMEVVMKATPQREGLLFKCEITGEGR